MSRFGLAQHKIQNPPLMKGGVMAKRFAIPDRSGDRMKKNRKMHSLLIQMLHRPYILFLTFLWATNVSTNGAYKCQVATFELRSPKSVSKKPLAANLGCFQITTWELNIGNWGRLWAVLIRTAILCHLCLRRAFAPRVWVSRACLACLHFHAVGSFEGRYVRI